MDHGDHLHHDAHHYDQGCQGLRLGEECTERNPGQLVCGCSNIGQSDDDVMMMMMMMMMVMMMMMM